MTETDVLSVMFVLAIIAAFLGWSYAVSYRRERDEITRERDEVRADLTRYLAAHIDTMRGGPRA